MKITFKFDKQHATSTIRNAYKDNIKTNYSIISTIRPTLYIVREGLIVLARFVTLEQAKKYIEDKLKGE